MDQTCLTGTASHRRAGRIYLPLWASHDFGKGTDYWFRLFSFLDFQLSNLEIFRQKKPAKIMEIQEFIRKEELVVEELIATEAEFEYIKEKRTLIRRKKGYIEYLCGARVESDNMKQCIWS